LVDGNGEEHFFSSNGVRRSTAAEFSTGTAAFARRNHQAQARGELLGSSKNGSATGLRRPHSRSGAQGRDPHGWKRRAGSAGGSFESTRKPAPCVRRGLEQAGPSVRLYIERSRKLDATSRASGWPKGLASRASRCGRDVARDARVWQQSIAIKRGCTAAFVFPVYSDGKMIAFSLSTAARSSRPTAPDEAIHVIGARSDSSCTRKQGGVWRQRREFPQPERALIGRYVSRTENFRLPMVSTISTGARR